MSSSRESDHRAIVRRRLQRADKNSNASQALEEDPQPSVTGTSVRVDPSVDAGADFVHVHVPSYPPLGTPTHSHAAGPSSGSIARGVERDRDTLPQDDLAPPPAELDVHRVIGRALAQRREIYNSLLRQLTTSRSAARGVPPVQGHTPHPSHTHRLRGLQKAAAAGAARGVCPTPPSQTATRRAIHPVHTMARTLPLAWPRRQPATILVTRKVHPLVAKPKGGAPGQFVWSSPSSTLRV